MTDKNEHSPSDTPTPQRRGSSFAGQAFADMFSRSRNPEGHSPPNHGPITSAAAEASRRRRLSVSTMGLSSSPNQSSSFSAQGRRESISSSAGGTSIDESAVEDEPMSASAPQQAGPFGRRVSFGARALKDMKGGAGAGAGGGGTGHNGSSSIIIEEDVDGEKKTFAPTSKLGRGEGFNWADNMRTRAERTSIGGVSSSPTSTGGMMHRTRAKSVAVMDQPVRDSPKPVNVPDQFQERILKGDFYMD